MSTKILILGASGMLGHNLIQYFSRLPNYRTFGTVRKQARLENRNRFPGSLKIISGINAEDFNKISNLIRIINPDVVINSIGLIKQAPDASDPEKSIFLNALFPHKLAKVCLTHKTRLIHISTDCVFSGQKGDYREDDPSDAQDLYGRTKYLGEITYPGTLTIRTSIIGHELHSKLGLVEWFLSQKDKVKGYTRAMFTGFPTAELAKILADRIIPIAKMSGLYHVASQPISKYELLQLIAKEYKKRTKIEPDDNFVCDRSLNADSFNRLTGYRPPAWSKLIAQMQADFLKSK